MLDQLRAALQARYSIQHELGRGGMAVVYLADDLRHDRKVAIKVLEPEFARLLGTDRFLREIQMAARLHHPHLLPVYDSGNAEGTLYYVSPFIEGGSVRELLRAKGPLPLRVALRLIREAAEGLDYAHRHNVMHRDIKPENLLLEDEHAIIADFGIARAVNAVVQGRGAASLTQTGLLVGTPAYMSPEQADGSVIDGRADIYSLGCVLFELITGTPAFTGSSAVEIFVKRWSAPSPSLHEAGARVPAFVEALADRALAKVPAERFQSAREMADAMSLAEAALTRAELNPQEQATEPSPLGSTPGSAAGPATTGTPTLAVLPFLNLSADRENEYFSDGLTEELINVFARMPGLRVASRTSAFAFKGKDMDVREIGQRLAVGNVLEGSVRRAGNRIRITAQLISVAHGFHLWSETYDREIVDVFVVQDDLARAIAGALKLRLLSDGTLLRAPTANPDAYTHYLKGRFFWNKRTPEALQKGIECFQQAIAADREYALAYAGLADSYHMLGVYGVLDADEAYTHARAAAARALEIGPDLPEPHLSRAYTALCYERDWGRAERETRRALELDPRWGQAHHWLAWSLLMVAGKAEAADEARRAIELEPLSPIILARTGLILTWAGYPAEGEAGALRALELDPTCASGYEALALGQLRLGRFDEAVASVERGVGAPGSACAVLLPWILAMAGRPADALSAFRRLDFDLGAGRAPKSYPVMFIAWMHIALGNVDEAFRWLDYAVTHHVWPLLLDADTTFDPIRGDPRFQELRKRMGLPGAAEAPRPATVQVATPSP